MSSTPSNVAAISNIPEAELLPRRVLLSSMHKFLKVLLLVGQKKKKKISRGLPILEKLQCEVSVTQIIKYSICAFSVYVSKIKSNFYVVYLKIYHYFFPFFFF